MDNVTVNSDNSYAVEAKFKTLSYEKADRIVGVIVGNLINLSTNKKIYLKEFNSKSLTHRLFLIYSGFAAAATSSEVYVDMGLFTYWYWHFRHKKWMGSAKRAPKGNCEPYPSIDAIINYMCAELDITETTLEEIYHMYCEDNDENNCN